MELKKILHVDDDEDIRTIVQIALEVVGQFELRQCPDGPSAVTAVGQARPDLVLLDVMMPGMSGREVWEALKADPATADIPVIFVTAKAEDDFSEQLRADGAMAVVTKPFDPMTLADDLLRIWAGRRTAEVAAPSELG